MKNTNYLFFKYTEEEIEDMLNVIEDAKKKAWRFLTKPLEGNQQKSVKSNHH